ncbi:CPBP family intramembrane metalloprotease [bacterium]|nr:CPBP family intramembrane metalloprotease [bacterium]
MNSDRDLSDGLAHPEPFELETARPGAESGAPALPAIDDPGMAEAAAFHEVWESDSLPDEPTAPLRVAREPARRHKAGIGLPEAVLWTVGVLAVHVMGGIAAVAWILISHVMQGAAGRNPGAAQAAVQELFTDRLALQTLMGENVLTLLIGEMGIFVAAAVFFSLLRVGWSPRQKLGLTAISTRQFLLILAAIVPLSLVCGTLHQWTTAGWEAIAEHFPVLQSAFEGADVNQQLKPLSDKAPLGLLILVIALAPAIGEEIVFRGVIGRGLVARYGVLPGVIVTSLLFASVHLHPAHVVALLPLAFFIHFVYLTTRSFWAPVLLHFANNSLAAILLKVGSQLEGTALADDQGLPIWGFAVAAVLVGLAAWALWANRVEYRLPSGRLWSLGYESVEMPPVGSGAVAVQLRGNPGFCSFALLSAFLFTGLFAVSIAVALQDAAVLAK